MKTNPNQAQLKRYDLSIMKSLNSGKVVTANVKERPEGEYVKYKDVMPIILENEKLKRTIEAIENEEDGVCPVCLKEGCEPECDVFEEEW